jgi:hypothetical protein
VPAALSEYAGTLARVGGPLLSRPFGGAAWLNVAECELSVLEWQCLARRLPDVETLTREVAAWEHGRKQVYVTIDGRLTTADARIK